MRYRGFEECGLPELRRFFLYLENGHEQPGGRWGNPKLTTPMRPVSAATYYAYLKGFFCWLVKEEVLPATPFVRLEGPDTETDQIQPFMTEQVEALLGQARRSPQALRDVALLWLMVSTGIRTSELCGLQRKNLNLDEGYVQIYGKRQKY